MVFWKIAFRNVKKNWRHSLSALLSISASFVSLVLFDGYIDDLKQMYEDTFRHRSMLGDLLIEKPGIHEKQGLADPWMFSLYEEDQNRINLFLERHADMVRNRVRFVNFQGMVTNGEQSAIVLGRGIDVKEGEQIRGKNWSWNATFGKPLHPAQADSTMLGQGLARKLGCSWDTSKSFYSFSGGYEPVERSFECPSKDVQVSVMTEEGQLNALDLNVAGLLDAGYRDIDDRYLLTSVESAQTLMNTKSITMMAVELKRRNMKDEFVGLFNNEIGKDFPEIKIMTWLDHPVGETYLKTLDLMAIFRNFVVLVILIISVLSVVNTLIKIIKERSREIGTLRSLGFKSTEVIRMFIYETVLLSMLGSLIGCGAAFILTVFLDSLHIRYKAGLLSEPVLFRINFSVEGYFNAFAILVGVSLLACLYSIRQEINKKIVDNFNHV